MRNKSILLALIIFVTYSLHAQQFYNVLTFGAKNDSSSLCTKAIASAINAAEKKGGGTIYFPAGKYLTGPIHLKSNITIFIDAGAELHFTDNFDEYLPMVASRFEGTNVNSFSPLFYAYKAENIAIKGSGIINGHGQKWWAMLYKLMDKANKERTKWQDEFVRSNPGLVLPEDSSTLKRGFLRPPFIQPMYCRNVLVEGIRIVNSPFWTVNPEFCENVTVTGVTIANPTSPNTDGINPESCKYVHISNCHISVGDDCITIKSGKDVDGRKAATPAENYTITNCTMLSGHGGVVIGSEMSGDVRKISISNCIFDGTDRGIRIKTTRGRGGIVEEIRVSNIVMKNIKQQAVVLDMAYTRTQPEPVSERTPRFRNIHLANITAQTKQAIFINGLAEMPVENISFTDIQFEAETGATIKEAANIEFHNVTINTTSGPSIAAENVSRLIIDDIKTMRPLNVAAVELNNVQDVWVRNCFPLKSPVFLSVKGNKTNGVVVKGNNFKNVEKPLVKDASVVENIAVEN